MSAKRTDTGTKNTSDEDGTKSYLLEQSAEMLFISVILRICVPD